MVNWIVVVVAVVVVVVVDDDEMKTFWNIRGQRVTPYAPLSLNSLQKLKKKLEKSGFKRFLLGINAATPGQHTRRTEQQWRWRERE